MRSLTPHENRQTFLWLLNSALMGLTLCFLLYNYWNSYWEPVSFAVNLGVCALAFLSLLAIRTWPRSALPVYLVLVNLLLVAIPLFATVHKDYSRIYWIWPVILVLIYTQRRNVSIAINALLYFLAFFLLVDPLQIGTELGTTKDQMRLMGALGIFLLVAYTTHYFHSRLETSLSRLAYRDWETELLNENGILQTIRENIAKKTPFSVLLFDLDKFQRISRTLGKDGTSRLIAVLVRFLGEKFSQENIARISQDRFAVLCPFVERREIESYIQHITEQLQQISNSSSQEIYLTAGFGVALALGDTLQAEQILQYADLALQEAKALQANSIVFYNEKINEKFQKKQSIRRLISRGLKLQEFHLVYQPQFRLSDMRPVCIEALVRWKQEELGYISPAEFVPIAEESNLIFALGDYVREEAFRTLKSLHEMGFSELRLSINLSPRELIQANLAERVTEKIHQFSLETRHVILEITEGVLLEYGLKSMRALRKLKECGLRVALDDYGTGYAGVPYLLRFQIQSLKIDRSLVANLERHRHKKALLQGILTTTQAMQIESVCEGVETQPQIDWLKNSGCDLVQGYLPARPLPLESLKEFLRNQYEK